MYNEIKGIMGAYGHNADYFRYDSVQDFAKAVRDTWSENKGNYCLSNEKIAYIASLNDEDFLREVGADWFEEK